MPLRLIFMGTPDFAVPTLLALHGGGDEIVAVYTREPKPGGPGVCRRFPDRGMHDAVGSNECSVEVGANESDHSVKVMTEGEALRWRASFAGDNLRRRARRPNVPSQMPAGRTSCDGTQRRVGVDAQR